MPYQMNQNSRGGLPGDRRGEGSTESGTTRT